MEHLHHFHFSESVAEHFKFKMSYSHLKLRFSQSKRWFKKAIEVAPGKFKVPCPSKGFQFHGFGLGPIQAKNRCADEIYHHLIGIGHPALQPMDIFQNLQANISKEDYLH